MSELKNLQQRALEVRAKYNQLNAHAGHQAWGAKDYAMGFVGDVGDLMKLVAAKEGMRAGQDIDVRLSHELADCLWSLLVLASHYNIDLEQAFVRTMDDLDQRIDKELQA